MTEHTDRELLELAAKAAGHDYSPAGYIVVDGIPGNWNPLEDDGDALRLAGKLRVSISYACTGITDDIYASAPMMVQIFQPVSDDISAATRRAIVLAAAAIAVGDGQ